MQVVALDKKANLFKARCWHGSGGCISGRYNWEGHAYYPEGFVTLPVMATVAERL